MLTRIKAWKYSLWGDGARLLPGSLILEDLKIEKTGSENVLPV